MQPRPSSTTRRRAANARARGSASSRRATSYPVRAPRPPRFVASREHRLLAEHDPLLRAELDDSADERRPVVDRPQPSLQLRVGEDETAQLLERLHERMIAANRAGCEELSARERPEPSAGAALFSAAEAGGLRRAAAVTSDTVAGAGPV